MNENQETTLSPSIRVVDSAEPTLDRQKYFKCQTLTRHQNPGEKKSGKARSLDLQCSWGITRTLSFGDRCFILSYGGSQHLFYILIVGTEGLFKRFKYLNPLCWQATAPLEEHSSMIVIPEHPISDNTQFKEVIQNHLFAIILVTEITF